MSWIQIELKTVAEHCAELEIYLFACGACSVTFLDDKDQPIYEPDQDAMPLWAQTRLLGLFTADSNVSDIIEKLAAEVPHTYVDYRIEYLKDKAWEKESMKDFSAMQFGKKLWICPSWCEPPDPDAVNVLLDPGCGFGTGTHPSTAMCLEWLGHHMIHNKSVIDYGCGSGILGISAKLLGAGLILGVDIDAQALEASRLNAVRNGIDSEEFKVMYPGEDSLAPADVLLANILSGPLVELAPSLAALVVSDGDIILSGILIDQADGIMKAYSPWFEFAEPATKDEWVCLAGKRIH